MTGLIVLNYNDYVTTERFINKVRDYNSLDKIIVVDNCSTDNSYEQLQKYKNRKIDVIKTDANNGYAYGNNYGAFYAIGKYKLDELIISNPDVEIEEEAIKDMLLFLKHSKGIGTVTCQMVCTSGIEMPVAWKIPRYFDCLMENFIILSKIVGKRTHYKEDYFDSEISEVEVVPGSLFLIKADVFNEIDGFDEETFLYYEENMLAFRLREKNYINIVLNNVKYIHNHSVSINKTINSVRKRLDINFESRCIYCDKYLKINTLKKILLKIAYKIGTFNYILSLKLRKQKR